MGDRPKRGCELWEDAALQHGWTWSGARARESAVTTEDARVELRAYDARYGGVLVVGSAVLRDCDHPHLPDRALPRTYSVAWVGDAIAAPPAEGRAVRKELGDGKAAVVWGGMARHEAALFLADMFNVTFDSGVLH